MMKILQAVLVHEITQVAILYAAMTLGIIYSKAEVSTIFWIVLAASFFLVSFITIRVKSWVNKIEAGRTTK